MRGIALYDDLEDFAKDFKDFIFDIPKTTSAYAMRDITELGCLHVDYEQYVIKDGLRFIRIQTESGAVPFDEVTYIDEYYISLQEWEAGGYAIMKYIDGPTVDEPTLILATGKIHRIATGKIHRNIIGISDEMEKLAGKPV